MTGPPWTWRRGDTPIVAAAIHAGHELRGEVMQITALDDLARLREEDPFTDRWTAVAPTAVVVHRSRWEVDLNRPRDRSVYRHPEEAWGLEPWRSVPPPDVLERSRALHDAFYAELHSVCTDVAARHGRFVLLDLHTYNHRRAGPSAPPADPAGNPVVNVGTRSLDRAVWGPLIDRFLEDLRAQGLDARENVRFGGATIAAEIHRAFPGTGCCLAIDVKKVFMDEHTGAVDDDHVGRIGDALARSVPGLVASLRRGETLRR